MLRSQRIGFCLQCGTWANLLFYDDLTAGQLIQCPRCHHWAMRHWPFWYADDQRSGAWFV